MISIKSGIDEGLYDKDGVKSSIHCLTQKSINKERLSTVHYHNYIEILYGIDCNATVWADEKRLRFKSGDLCLIRPNETHYLYSKNSYNYYYVIKFLPELLISREVSLKETAYIMPITVNREDMPPILIEKQYVTDKMKNAVKDIFEEWNGGKNGYEFAIKGSILQLFSEIIRVQYKKTEIVPYLKENSALAATIYSAAEDIMKDCAFITENEAARRCNMSYSYFSRNFKSVMGKSFTQFVCAARIDSAKRMLLTEDISITEIAMRMGFSSASHFAASFKRHTGKSPLVYKKSVMF